MSENLVRNIYLGVGSNLGNKKINIEKAKFKLSQNNIIIEKVSNYYESLSWPNTKDPKFLNIIIKIITIKSPKNLLKLCKKIERDMGRKKGPKNSPRICDIDLIDYDNRKLEGDIILPHPRMHTRNFVLMPMYELDKDWRHPILKHSIKKLILSLPNRDIRSIKQI